MCKNRFLLQTETKTHIHTIEDSGKGNSRLAATRTFQRLSGENTKIK